MRNLKKYRRQLEKDGKLDEAAEYDFFPMTYNLPTEYPTFSEEFKKNTNSVWIMKPIGKSQGRGIFLFNKLNQISNWRLDNRRKSENVESYVVQKYINNPLLIGGKKFDLRIYCLVTSFAPLTVYFYRNGFARFTHHRYDNQDLTNTFVHLTNVAIQKTSENYDEKLGGKWNIDKLKQYMISKFGKEEVNKCFSKIQDLVVRTLQGAQKLIMNDKHCFELYGFDVLLDDNLKPWLLEVNGSPSMTANTEQDAQLKCNLLDDVFTILDLEKILTGQEKQIGGFDLVCKGEYKKSFPTMLGCRDNRLRLFTTMAKELAEKLKQNKENKKVQVNNSKSTKVKSRILVKNKENISPNSLNYLSFSSTCPQGPSPCSIFDNINLESPKLLKNISAPDPQVFDDLMLKRNLPARLPAIRTPKSKTLLKSKTIVPQIDIQDQIFFSPSPKFLAPIHGGTMGSLNLRRKKEEISMKLPFIRPMRPGTALSTSRSSRNFEFGNNTMTMTMMLNEMSVKELKADGLTLIDSLSIGKVKYTTRGSDPSSLQSIDENSGPFLSSRDSSDKKRKVKTCRIKVWNRKLGLTPRKENQNDEESQEEKYNFVVKSGNENE